MRNKLLESRGSRLQLSLEWLKKIHQILLPTGKKDQVQYRKDNPIHRMYFHDLAPADKISYRMRKLTDWFRTEECRKAHPIELAVEVHRELIRIFPWPDISGRVARMAMNAILYESLTVAEFLIFVGRVHGLDEATIERRAKACLETFEIGERAASRIAELSKGMRQKVLLTSARTSATGLRW